MRLGRTNALEFWHKLTKIGLSIKNKPNKI